MPIHKRKHRPLIIGWREVVSLPDWGVHGVLAKSDTGAMGSAIDVRHIEELPGGRIRFDVVVDRTGRVRTRTVEAEVTGQAVVKSSNGAVQRRHRVRTSLRIGDVEKLVDFTLVNRKGLICRALLGRNALGHDFLVDSQSTYLFGPRKRAGRRRTPVPGARDEEE